MMFTMLRIRKAFDNQTPVLALSGRLDQEHLSELQALLEAEGNVGESNARFGRGETRRSGIGAISSILRGERY